jgi:DNA-directed RNA polymerase III subunit RPC11
MLFCPNCANLLVISAQTGYNKWACNTCAYEFPIAKQVVQKKKTTSVYSAAHSIPKLLTVDDIPNKNDPQTSGRRPGWRRGVETCRFDNGYASSRRTASITTLSDKKHRKATCPKCDNDRAYFYQLQIRSADEPMTTCKSLIFSFSQSYPSTLQSIGEWPRLGPPHSPFMHLLWFPQLYGMHTSVARELGNLRIPGQCGLFTS